jgi:hypothetical protein
MPAERVNFRHLNDRIDPLSITADEHESSDTFSTSATHDANAPPPPGEPSLGPACLVISILSLAVFSSVCAFGSWIVFSDQYPLAEKAITKQLIPWVETSQLAKSDKQSILNQLHELAPVVAERQISKAQLLRLRNCLQDNPVLLWGGVQSILAQAPTTDLSATELATLTRIERRLMRMAAERKLSRRDLEFTLQEFSDVRADGLSIEVKSDLNAEQIRMFMKRAESLLDSNQISNEDFDKSPAETFEILVENALEVT